MSALYELTGQMLELEAMLTDPDIDPEIVADTLEGLQGELEEKLESCGKVIEGMQGDIKSIDAEIKRLQARKKVYENSLKSMKKYIISCMQAMDKKKVVTTMFLFTVKDGVDSAVVPNEEDVPEEYRIKQPDKIDVAGIKAYLKTGKSLDYAYLQKGDPSLLIK